MSWAVSGNAFWYHLKNIELLNTNSNNNRASVGLTLCQAPLLTHQTGLVLNLRLEKWPLPQQRFWPSPSLPAPPTGFPGSLFPRRREGTAPSSELLVLSVSGYVTLKRRKEEVTSPHWGLLSQRGQRPPASLPPVVVPTGLQIMTPLTLVLALLSVSRPPPGETLTLRWAVHPDPCLTVSWALQPHDFQLFFSKPRPGQNLRHRPSPGGAILKNPPSDCNVLCTPLSCMSYGDLSTSFSPTSPPPFPPWPQNPSLLPHTRLHSVSVPPTPPATE